MKGERECHFFQEGEVMSHLLHKGDIREDTAQKGTDETTDGDADKNERGSERNGPIVGDLGDHGLGNAERAVRESVKQTDPETHIVVFTQPQSEYTHHID